MIFLQIFLCIIGIEVLRLYQKQKLKLEKCNKIINLLINEQNKNISISKFTHEIKNPLSVCNGYIEMINYKNNDKLGEYLQIIKNELDRTITIINDFSSYKKLTNLNLEEIDLVYLLEEINITLNPIFQNNNAKIILNINKEIYLNADYNKLKQVFINLLKNTLEAKKENENLIVKININIIKDNVEIIIEDNGVGMSKEQLNKIFDLFYTTKQTGTGIGTAYSKEVIELHGGTIKYKSKINKGTKVYINLPKFNTT